MARRHGRGIIFRHIKLRTPAGGSSSQEIVDVVGVTDSVTQSTTYTVTIADSIGVTDAVLDADTDAQSFLESIALADSVAQVVAAAREPNDPIGITEILVSALTAPRAPNDLVGLVDAIAVVQTHVRAINDNIGLTDAIIDVDTIRRDAGTLQDLRPVTAGFADRGAFPNTVSFRDPTPSTVAAATSPMALNQQAFDTKWLPDDDSGEAQIFSGIVVNVPWSALQPTGTGAVGSAIPTNVIDTAITAVEAWNAANPNRKLQIDVRISGGFNSPQWVKDHCGVVKDGSTYYRDEHNQTVSPGADVPIWWNTQNHDCYASLLTEFQTKYGNEPLIASVSSSRGPNEFPENMLYSINADTPGTNNWTALFASGFTDAIGQAAWLDAIQQHADLLPAIRTRVACNPYERFDVDGGPDDNSERMIGGFASGPVAVTLMQNAVDILGERCIIEIDNTRPSYLAATTGGTALLYAAAAVLTANGVPLRMQTATAVNMEGTTGTDAWRVTVQGCIDLGACCVEPPTDYYNSSVTATVDAIPWTDNGLNTGLLTDVAAYALELRSAGENLTHLERIGIDDSAVAATTYNRTIADTVGLTDTTVGLIGSFVQPNDAVGVVDNTTQVTQHVRSINDLVGVTDQLLDGDTNQQTHSHNVGLTDAISVVVTRVYTINDTVGISDAVTQVATIVRGPNDLVGVVDGQSVVYSNQPQTFTRSVADVIGVDDSTTQLQVSPVARKIPIQKVWVTETIQKIEFT